MQLRTWKMVCGLRIERKGVVGTREKQRPDQMALCEKRERGQKKMAGIGKAAKGQIRNRDSPGGWDEDKSDVLVRR